MEQSLTKTLAHKLRRSVSKIYHKYRAILWVEGKPYKGLQVTLSRGANKKPLQTQWGGIPLKRKLDTVLNDTPPRIWNTRTELEERLLANSCELCGSHQKVEVHHIRALKDLTQPGRRQKPEWVKAMARRQRKTLVVCHKGRVRAERVGFYKDSTLPSS